MNLQRFYKLFKPIEWLNVVLPKKEKQILFYSNMGFRDNVRSLFEYMIKNNYNEKYSIVCSLDDYQKYESRHIKNVKFVSCKRGVSFFLTSKYMFYCFGKYPIMPSKKQVVINLWHGMPLKKIGRLEDANKNNKYDYFTKVIATSAFFKPILAKTFGCEESRVLLCGQPRTDELFTKTAVKGIFQIPVNNKLFLWMPTFRFSEKLGGVQNGEITGNGLPICCTNEKLTELDSILERYKAICFIKMHPMQKRNLKFGKKDFTHIRFLEDEQLEKYGVSLYEFISCADALITDYSSVYIDYLLLNRPICFTIDDIEKYENSRGFVTDFPLDLMPGKHVTNFLEFSDFVKEVTCNQDDYEENRLKAREKFHLYPDDKNTERLLRYCGLLRY